MQINRVLHPELVLDKRGDPHLRDLYKEVKKNVTLTPTGGNFTNKLMSLTDEKARDHMMMTRRFQAERPKVYHVGKHFLEALSSIDREIPVDLLPDYFFGYISFARDVLEDDLGFVEGGYVTIVDATTDVLSLSPRSTHGKYLWVSYLNQPECGYPVSTKFTVDLTDGKVSDWVKGITSADYSSPGESKPVTEEQTAKRVIVVRTLINLVLYLHSVGAEVKKSIPKESLSHSKRSKHKASGGLLTDCTLPVYMINPSYETERHYTLDATWVKTHLRWQRCGPEHSQVKLIWVKPHERKYNNNKEQEKMYV